MGKSARILGRDFGLTAREMNALLKEHGYLSGEPGAYGMTEKGLKYGSEDDHRRGTGGYTQYNPQWTTRTWSDDISAALAADIATEPTTEAPATAPVVTHQPEDEFDLSSGFDKESDDPKTEPPLWMLAAFLGVVVAAQNPVVQDWVGTNVTPHARRAWRKVSRRDARDAATKHIPEDAGDDGEPVDDDGA